MSRRAGPSVVVTALVLLASPESHAQRPRAVDACIASSESAQVDRNAGKLHDAKEKLARCLASDCPPLIRKDCETFLAEVDRTMPTVVFRVRSADGADVVDAAIRVDAEPRPTAVDGRVREIDPGPHDVEVTAAGRPPTHLRIVAEETVKGRVVEVTLAAAPAPAPAPAPERSPSREDAPRAPITWAGTIALGGVGVLGLGTFAVVGLGADSDYRALESSCGTRCAPESTADVRDRFRVADVALGIGVVALAASALVYVLGPRTPVDRRVPIARGDSSTRAR